MIAGLLAAALVLGAPSSRPTAEAPPREAAPADDALPDGAGRALVRERCLVCHSADYVTQQRLTAGQWQKTVEKMRKFGANLADDEAKVLTDYLARGWPVGLPDQAPAPVKPPTGSAPLR